MKLIACGFLAAFSFLQGSATTASACKYCGMAIFDDRPTAPPAPDAATSSPGPVAVGSFPEAAPPKPQSTTRVVTQAVELGTARPKVQNGQQLRLMPVSAVSASVAAQPGSAAKIPEASDGSARWANAGLLALAAGGGLFFWRTRHVVP